MPTHIVIPDTQVKSGVPTTHLKWVGQYIVDEFKNKPEVTIIHIGDHWDMPSLSAYDRGKKAMEGRRYVHDIEAGNDGFDLLNEALNDFNRKQRKHGREEWRPRKVFTLGNHENRIVRATEDNAQLDGVVSLDDLNAEGHGWEIIPFLEPIFIDGIGYCHYYYNPNTGRPYGGLVDTRLKQIGHSFTMGHQQGLQYSLRTVARKTQHGLVCGSCYLHQEVYLGPQGNDPWVGIVVCHEVRDGSFDPMFVSLDYLCRRYEGTSLSDYRNELRKDGYEFLG